MTIQETNIERALIDHLWKEIKLLIEKREELRIQQDALVEREEKLRRIAVAAGIPEPIEVYTPDPRD